MAKKQAPQPLSITVEVDGETYEGHYSVESKVVTVSCGLGRKSTQIGGSTAASVARLLLIEIVRKSQD